MIGQHGSLIYDNTNLNIDSITTASTDSILIGSISNDKYYNCLVTLPDCTTCKITTAYNDNRNSPLIKYIKNNIGKQIYLKIELL